MEIKNLPVFTALTYVITDVRVRLFTLINLLVEKGIITADEFDAMQKKCEVKEGIPVMKEIKAILDGVAE